VKKVGGMSSPKKDGPKKDSKYTKKPHQSRVGGDRDKSAPIIKPRKREPEDDGLPKF